MDFDGSVGAFGDAPGQRARRQLALLAQHENPPAQLGDDNRLDHQNDHRHHAQPHALQQHEIERRQRISTQERGLDEGIADEAAQRLHLVLDHGGDFRLLHLAELGLGKAQEPVEQVEAQAAQHALAHLALGRVDVDLEPVVDDHEDQEQRAYGDQVGRALQAEAVEQHDRRAAEEPRQAEFQMHEGAGPVGVGGKLGDGVDDGLG